MDWNILLGHYYVTQWIKMDFWLTSKINFLKYKNGSCGIIRASAAKGLKDLRIEGPTRPHRYRFRLHRHNAVPVIKKVNNATAKQINGTRSLLTLAILDCLTVAPNEWTAVFSHPKMGTLRELKGLPPCTHHSNSRNKGVLPLHGETYPQGSPETGYPQQDPVQSNITDRPLIFHQARFGCNPSRLCRGVHRSCIKRCSGCDAVEWWRNHPVKKRKSILPLTTCHPGQFFLSHIHTYK